MANNYLATASYDTEQKETSSLKVFLIYKFHLTSDAMIAQATKPMSFAAARAYFRKIAQQVHPDKNKHKLAKEVFQKIKMIVEPHEETY